MKSVVLKAIAILSLGLIYSGCEKDIAYNSDDYSTKMILNSMIDSRQDTHFIKISESVFVYSDQKPELISNPNLEVKVNDSPVEITHDHNLKKSSYYKFEASLNPGDKIEVSGYSQAHGNVKGVDVIPQKPHIVAVTPEWFIGETDERSYLRTKIKIKDIADETNFYRIVIHHKTIFEESRPEEKDWISSEVYVDQEILFEDVLGTLGETNTNLFNIFSDELLQGREYTLNVYIQKDRFLSLNTKHYIKAEIHSLSENLYRYLRSLELASSADNFSEPVKLFSNIEGGFGVLGTYTIDHMIVEVEK